MAFTLKLKLPNRTHHPSWGFLLPLPPPEDIVWVQTWVRYLQKSRGTQWPPVQGSSSDSSLALHGEAQVPGHWGPVSVSPECHWFTCLLDCMPGVLPSSPGIRCLLSRSFGPSGLSGASSTQRCCFALIREVLSGLPLAIAKSSQRYTFLKFKLF